MASSRPWGWSASKQGTEPDPAPSSESLPAGVHLQPSLGPELYFPPSSPASLLFLDLALMLFLVFSKCAQ